MKGEINMPNKLLEREETLPANSLRSISQKSLLEMVENYEKIGLIINNNLSVAMLSWDKYEDIVDLIEKQNKEIAELQGVIEDIQLADEYGEDVVRSKQGLNKSHDFDSAEDLFNMIERS